MRLLPRPDRSFSAALRIAALALLALLAGCGAPPTANTSDAALPELSITVFAAPSQSLWIPTLIQALQLDRKHGFQLKVTPKPGPVAYTDFASGNDQVCYCAAPAAVARFVEQGSDIALLWNVFDLNYYVVSHDVAIASPRDLVGRRLAADTGTGQWAIAAWMLEQDGLDLSKVELHSISNPTAQLAELSLGRVDAVVEGMIDVATLQTSEQGQGLHVIALDPKAALAKHQAGSSVPSIAFGVWRPWLDQPGHRELAQQFYQANLDAVAWLRAHPAQAAKIVAERTGMSATALQQLFEHNPEMIDVHPIGNDHGAIALLTQDLLPKAGLLERPLTDAELGRYVSNFAP